MLFCMSVCLSLCVYVYVLNFIQILILMYYMNSHSNERYIYTVEPRFNEVLGTMKITLLYQVSHYIRVEKQRNIKRWDQQNYLVIIGFCYIRPLYNKVPLYHPF